MASARFRVEAQQGVDATQHDFEKQFELLTRCMPSSRKPTELSRRSGVSA